MILTVIGVFVLQSVLLLCFNYSQFKPGLNVIIVNNTDRYIDELEFVTSTGSEVTSPVIGIPPRTTVIAHREIRYGDGTGMRYKNDKSEVIEVPVMYIFGTGAINQVIVTINSFDDDGNINDLMLEDNLDTRKGRWLTVRCKALWLLISSKVKSIFN